MFYPPSGYYEESKCLEHTLTPASDIIWKTIKKIEIAGNVVNVVSNVCMAGGIIFPKFAPLLVPSAIIGITANMITVTRSVEKIVDLKMHKESLTSSLGCQYLLDLVISLLSTANTIGNGVKVVSELKISKMLFSRMGNTTIKTLSTINSGVCVLDSSVEAMSLSMQIKNRRKLIIKDLMALRLDLFLATGQLWSPQRFKYFFERYYTNSSLKILVYKFVKKKKPIQYQPSRCPYTEYTLNYL
ncbi:Domain of unknown function DUF4781 [Cinara cedri]|uniref:DUF4781 domain-containing protein n=1 Tax=Cinara cedri TaxID=506608 RepID=A0A5E4MZ31_9HEMI|nr:Domain of unknown function DUF4781 [Cinara cedri]